MMRTSLFALILISVLACSNDSKDTAIENAALLQATPFNPNAGKTINNAEAKDMIKSYTAKYPDRLKGYYFGADAIKRVLSNKGAAGIRITQGLDVKGSQVMILVPTDSLGNTIDGDWEEFGQGCPPYCDDGTNPNPTKD